MGNGRVRGEAGFFVDKDGSTTKLQKSTNRNDGSGHLELNPPAGTSPRIAVHSHADSSGDRPSPQDIQSAKDKKMTIHILSKSGLWAVDPSGKVTRPYDSTADAFSRKKMVKPEHEFSNAPYSLAASARKAK